MKHTAPCPSLLIATVAAALVGVTGLAEIRWPQSAAAGRMPQVGEQVVYIADGSQAPGEVVDSVIQNGLQCLRVHVGDETIIAAPDDVRPPTPLLGF